jgi:hypothetical protein
MEDPYLKMTGKMRKEGKEGLHKGEEVGKKDRMNENATE